MVTVNLLPLKLLLVNTEAGFLFQDNCIGYEMAQACNIFYFQKFLLLVLDTGRSILSCYVKPVALRILRGQFHI